MKHLARLVLVLLWLPLCAAAQEDDGGFLTRTIENALSGAGRDVQLVGFRGALSSEASFERMTIADAEGIWLRLEDVRLNWSRAALLRGRLQVDRLSAATLELARLPEAEEEEPELPSAEAPGFTFSLPELPVSVNIEAFEVAEIVLGEPVLGQPARLSLAASARLDGDGLVADILAERIDDIRGRFDIDATVPRDGQQISLGVVLDEAAGGITARLLNLPGQPAVLLEVAGSGPLDDFTADIDLATEGDPRLSGQVELIALDTDSGAAPDRRVLAALNGDITALVAPEYRDFFGPDVGLDVDTVLRADGAIDVDAFALNAQAVSLQGQVRLNTDLWPAFIDVTGTIDADGEPVVLPGGDGVLAVQRVGLDLDFDATQENALTGVFDIAGFDHPEAQINRLELQLDGELDGDAGAIGQLLARFNIDATGIALADEVLSRTVGQSLQGAFVLNYIEDQPIRINGIDLSGADYGLGGQIIVSGLQNGFPTRLDLSARVDDLARFAEISGQALSGAADLAVVGSVTPLAQTFDLLITGQTRDLAIGIAQADAVTRGETDLRIAALRDETGTFVRDLSLRNDAIDLEAEASLRSTGSEVTLTAALDDIGRVVPEYSGAVTVSAQANQLPAGWQVNADVTAPYETELTLAGLATGPDADLDFSLTIPNVEPFAPQVPGSLAARGNVRQSPEGYRVDFVAEGPYQTTVNVDGLATGPDADVRFALAVPNVAPLVPQVEGPLSAVGRVQQSPDGFVVDITADGPHAARVALEGVVTGPDADVRFDLSVPDVQRYVPQVPGALQAGGRVQQSPDGYVVDVSASGPYAADVMVRGLATGPDAALSFEASVPNLAVLVPELRGPLSLAGDVARKGDAFELATTIDGPAGTTAEVAGQVAADASTTDLTINGALPLGLAGPFLAPRSVQGQAQFDLALRGPPGLSSLSGQVTTRGARFTAPNLRLGLSGLNATIGLSNGSARIDAEAGIDAGGRVSVSGPVNLTSLAADLAIALRNAVLTDPRIYAATLNADISVNGPLTGGARIAGNINLAEVNVTVPASGVTSVGAIPDIRHVGLPRPVARTRARAGVTDPDPEAGNGASARPYLLDIAIRAPGQIFVRGRGLNAELGGGLQISGNTNNVISAGNFDLIRGRLDIIGKRFNLDEGSIQFQGSVLPFIRFVTTTEIPDGTASIIVEGPATEPEISFTSVPEAPEDEVLSLIIFGRYVSELSAFQALELVNGLAELSGRKGIGVLGSLRQGIGLDELDVTTTESGDTQITAGKYITDNIYTDVTTSAEKGTDISVNIDLTDSLTGKATVEEDGNSSIGLFFERDY